MATFSDGAENGAINHDAGALASAGNMRQHLQFLLDSKEKQLQQAGTLGQRVLAQQVELEERIRQLQEVDADKGEDDDLSAEMRMRYRDLTNMLKSWEEENMQLSRAFGSDLQMNGMRVSPTMPYTDLPQDLPSHGPSAPSASQSRRAKNAAHRANDVEFAFEIGSSLLTEVRRLQTLLGERDKAIQEMKEEKDDLERALEGLRTALKTQEQSADKFKEENWELEVKLQDRLTQLTEAQAAAQRGESESKRLTKLLASTRESNDTYKNEVERLKTTMEEMRAKHETDVAQQRKQAAALVRDKSDLQQALDTYKAEVARAGRRLPRFGSPMSPSMLGSEVMTPKHEEDEEDPFSMGGVSTNRRRIDTSSLFPPDSFGGESAESSPEPSPSRPFLAPNHPSNEIEALQQKLAHAQRQLSTLKGSLAREKELRIDYRRKLLDAGVDLERNEEEDDGEYEIVEEEGLPRSRSKNNATLRGRGRGRGIANAMRSGSSRMTLAHKLGLAAMSPSSDVEDEDEIPTPIEASPATHNIPDLQVSEDTFESPAVARNISHSPSPNRSADDSMDPDFAHVLQRAPSNGSMVHTSSPPPVSRRGAARGGRGGAVGRRRGGTAFQEPRPSSLVGQPEALAAELGLGIGMESVAEDEPVKEREMAEFACQTDFVEPPPPLPPPPAPEPVVLTRDTADTGVQVDAPEPEPVVIIVPAPEPVVVARETADSGVQVDAPEPEPAVVPVPAPAPIVVTRETSDSGVQVDAPEPEPIVVPVPAPEAAVVARETADSGVQVDAPEPVVVARDTADSGVQVDAPKPEPVVVPVPVPVHVEPTPEPAVVKVDASLQTDTPRRAEISISTDAPVVPVLVDSGTFTEAHVLVPTSEVEVQTPHAAKADMETQTPAAPVAQMSEMEIQTLPVPEQVREVIQEVIVRPRTPERSEVEIQTSPVRQAFDTTPRASASSESGIGTGYARLRYLSSASTVTGVPPRLSMLQVVENDQRNRDRIELEDDLQTEIADDTEPETETDMEDYQDARSIVARTPSATDMEDYHDARSISAPTPSATDSIADFHSLSTMTDNEFSSEDEMDDVESIKASHLRPGTRSSRASSIMQTDAEMDEEAQDLTVTYESQAVETEPLPVEEPVKRTVSEMATQTDEWQPPLSTPVEKAPPAGFGLYKVVGNGGQQFQFVTPPPPPSAPLTPVTGPSSSVRDSTATIGATRPVRFSSLTNDLERRTSIESTRSGVIAMPEPMTRQYTQSLGPSMAPPVDKTRPPTMVLPPPPRMPPPPNSMPPPSFIPEKRRPGSALSNHREMPPPRPSSPPPPELIQRATTPTFGTVRSIPGGRAQRPHGGSVPPLGAGLRQLSSTASFRSATNDMSSGGLSAAVMLDSSTRSRNIRSATSLLSDNEDVGSRRSSISSDFHPRMPEPVLNGQDQANTSAATTRANMTGASSTDPTIIHAITQTMIGEFLYKYTRKTIGKGHGERRHKRFFWVHPYTRTLYWSSADPGATNVTEQNAKSAYIDSVRSVLDPNPMPPGLHQYSVIISTPQREMKITAPTKERHDIWLNALQFLLARPSPAPQAQGTLNGNPSTPFRNPHSMPRPVVSSPLSQRNGRSETSGMDDSPWSVTPRVGQRSRSQMSMRSSIGKRSGTPAAEYLRWVDGPGSPGARSLIHTFETSGAGLDDDDEDLDFEIHDTIANGQDEFEGLENVRACCDGMHTVGRSGLDPHQHHHHHHHYPLGTLGSDRQRDMHDTLHPSRPTSPAFSFRSRASSTKSRDGTGGAGSLFSRFGTRRSAKAPRE